MRIINDLNNQLKLIDDCIDNLDSGTVEYNEGFKALNEAVEELDITDFIIDENNDIVGCYIEIPYRNNFILVNTETGTCMIDDTVIYQYDNDELDKFDGLYIYLYNEILLPLFDNALED